MRFLKGLLGAFVFVEVVHLASLLLAPPTETPFAAVLWSLLLNAVGSATISAVFTVDSNPAWKPGSYAKYGACVFACAVVLVIVAAVLLGVQPSVWTPRYALQLALYSMSAGIAGGLGYAASVATGGR